MLILSLLLCQAPQITLLRSADAVAPVRIDRVTLAHKEEHVVSAGETVILYSLDGRASDEAGVSFMRDDAMYASGSALKLQAEKGATFIRFTLENATPRPRVVLKKTRALPAYSIAAKKGGARIVFAPSETAEPSWVFDVLDVEAGASVPEHKHEDAVEIILLVSGAAVTVVNGVSSKAPLVTIAKGALHSATFPSKARALQIYAPAGPEQRFRNAPAQVQGEGRCKVAADCVVNDVCFPQTCVSQKLQKASTGSCPDVVAPVVRCFCDETKTCAGETVPELTPSPR